VVLELILISDKASTNHLFCNLVSNDICEFDGFTEREYRSIKIICDVLYETFYALYRLEDAETAKSFFASFVELKNVHPEVEKTINYCLTRSQQNSLQPHMSTKSYQSIMLFLDQHFTRDNDNRDNSPNVRTIFFEENNFYEAVEKGNQAFVTSFLEKIIFDRARPSYSFLFNFNLCFQALDVICKAIKYAAQHQQIEILKLFLNFFQPGTRCIYESFILHRVLLNCIELETADGNIEAMTLLIKKSQEFGHDYKYLFDKNSENDLGKFYQSIMKDIALAGQAPLLKMLVSGKILGHTALFPTNIKDALSQEVLKQKYYGVFFKQTMLEVVRGDRDAYQIMQVFLSEFSLLKIPLCDFFKYGMSAAGKGHAKIFELVLKQHPEKSNYQYINDIVFAYRAHGDLSYAPYSSTQDEDFDIYFAIEAAKNKKSNILECLFNKDRKIINKTLAALSDSQNEISQFLNKFLRFKFERFLLFSHISRETLPDDVVNLIKQKYCQIC
jgi:hypothetical protein